MIKKKLIINVIWILYYTKKGEDARDNKIGYYTLASIIIGTLSRILLFDKAEDSDFMMILFWFLLLTYLFFLRIAFALDIFKCIACTL